MGKKLAIGLLAAGLVAIAGYFGLRTYSQHEAAAEVERAFADMRARGASARFASASLDPRSKGLTLSGVEIVSSDKNASLSFDKLTATGAEPPRDGYVEADALDLEGVKITVSGAPAGGGSVTYLIPKVMIDRYRGPVSLISLPDGVQPATLRGALALALRQLAATAAAKVTIPQMSAHITSATAGEASLDVAYEGVAAEQISAGKIKSLLIDHAKFSGPVPPSEPAGPPPDGSAPGAAPSEARVDGEISGIVAAQIDTGPLLAIVSRAPARPGQDGYEEVYGKLVTGPHRLKYSTGETTSAASILLEQVGVKPAAFTQERLDALEALSHKGPDLSLEEASEYLEHLTDVLQAVTFRTMGMSDVRSEGPQETVKIASIRLEGFAEGALELFEVEGVDGHDARQQPMKMARLAVRRLDMPALVRFADDADASSVSAILELFKVVSGIEASGIEVPYENDDAGTAASLKVGDFKLAWGGFLGDLPTTLRIELNDAAGPISASDGEPFTYLANAGMTSASVSALLSLAYDADKQDLSLAPARMKVDKAFSVELNAGLGSLPKEAFADVGAAFDALGRLNGRPISLKLENLGLGELMITQLAEAAGVTPDALRQELVAAIDERAREWADVTRDAPAVAEAMKAFVMNPQTLTVTATPRTNAPLMPLLTSDDPLAVLQAYDITATAGP